MPDFAQARKNMVDCQIHPSGVISENILDAYRSVPRELFVPSVMAGIAYGDEDIKIGKGRTLLAPAVHARMVQAAEIKPSDKILDIGGAGGYSACILACLGAQVDALEDKSEFADTLAGRAKGLDLANVKAVTGPLVSGHPAGAPYDLIFIGGAVGAPPETFAAQLKPQGRMLAILRDRNARIGQVVMMRCGAGGDLSCWPLFEAGAAWLPGFEPRTAFKFGT